MADHLRGGPAAGSVHLRGGYTMKAEPLSGHLDRVTVDHAGRAGDVGQGDGGVEREPASQAERCR